jgi:effector-binding domain-containing protein
VIDVADIVAWYEGAMGELYGTLAAQRIEAAGPAGGVYTSELFTDERGEAMVFVPCAQAVRPTGRVMAVVVPGAELAVITHTGAHEQMDRAYGELATYVADHALAVDGPIREYYVVGRHETADESLWRTEIGWPIFRTAVSAGG